MSQPTNPLLPSLILALLLMVGKTLWEIREVLETLGVAASALNARQILHLSQQAVLRPSWPLAWLALAGLFYFPIIGLIRSGMFKPSLNRHRIQHARQELDHEP